MAVKSSFNIPIKINDITQWHTIQFQSKIDDVTGLSNTLGLYLTDGDQDYFNNENKLHPSLFPDAVLGQLIQVGFIEDPIDYQNIATQFREVKVTLTTTGQTVLKHKFPKIFDYKEFYITEGSAKDGEGTSYDDGTKLYMGYKDLPGVYFLTRITASTYPAGVIRNGFLGRDWYPDDWCVPTASGFGQITNHDAVTSVNEQIGHVYTYGGTVSECDYFYKGSFYQFDQNQWYPQYDENTTSNEIPGPGVFMAMCIKSGSKDSITWDQTTTHNGSQSLTKGNVQEFFISSAGRDDSTKTYIYLPYTKEYSTVIIDILNDFGNWILENRKYYDNALTAEGYTQSNYLYTNTSEEKTTIMGGLAKGTYRLLADQYNQWDEDDTRLGPKEDWAWNVPEAKTTNSTINDYKFYIQFDEILTGNDLL